MPATFTHGLNFFDLERTEVLRGPQGTLYGRNTTGGAINLITRTPALDGETTGNIKVGAGNFGSTSANGAIETSLIEDKLAARVAFTYDKNDGFFNNLLGGPDLAQTDFFGARLALNWQATERLNAVFKYTTGESSPLGIPGRGEGIFEVAPGVTVDIAGEQGFSRFEAEIDGTGEFNSQSDLATLRLTYDADNYSIVSVTSYNDAEFRNEADIDGHAGLTALNQIYSGTSESINQDLRFVSDFDGSFNFIAGLYYGREENTAQVTSFIANPFFNVLLASPDPIQQATGELFTQFGGLFQDLASTKTATAVYGQGRWQINDKLGLDIGLRFTDDEISRDNFNISRINPDGSLRGSFIPGNITAGTLNVNAPFIPPGILSPDNPGFFIDGPLTDGSAPGFVESEKEVTGKIGLDYKVSDDLLVYGSFNRGFRGGSINFGVQYLAAANPLDDYAAPEFVDAYEVGFKGDFLDGKLRVNGAAFYYDYTDQQFVTIVGISASLENAGASEIKGAEFEIWALPTENLSIKLGLGFLDTEFTELSLANEVTPDPTDEIDLSGNELISAPDLNVNLAIDYNIPVSWGRIHAHANANYQDDQFFSAYNDALNFGNIGQDAYWLVNARLTTLFGEDENFSISAWVNNLADEEYDTYAINLQSGFGLDYFVTGAPRTYGLEVGYRF